MIERDDDVNGYGVDYGQFDDASGYCRHGVYTGGCGIDFMCGLCESGYDTWVEHTYWTCLIVFPHNETGEVLSYIMNRRFDREEAEKDADAWETIIGHVPGVIAIYVYPTVSGYWSDGNDE